MAKKRSKNTYIPMRLIKAKGNMMYQPPSISSCKTLTSTSETSAVDTSVAALGTWSKKETRKDDMRRKGFQG